MELRSAQAERREKPPELESSWDVCGQRIVFGDCLTELRRLPASTVDVCVTSPPYNIGVAYNTHYDRMPKADYLRWMAVVGAEIKRVLRDEGSFFLNVGSTNVDPWLANEVADIFRSLFCLQNSIIWVKSLSIGTDTVGHFKPIASKRFLNNNFESIFHFTKTGAATIDRLAVGVPFKDKSNIARRGHARDLRCAGNVWFLPYATVRSKAQKFGHPAGFPVDLPARCIRLHGKEGATVLDPFLGAGTTLVAAAELGATGIGFENDRAYAEAAVARLKAWQSARPGETSS